MVSIEQTEEFRRWLLNLRDRTARGIIARRISRLASGNPGNVNSVGRGVSELRIPFGPGYRVYFVSRGPTLVLLLCGGDKSTQGADIEKAKKLAANEGESHGFGKHEV